MEDQATDRTHPIGQQRPVTAIRLIAQGTIEEAVIGLHDSKRALADDLLAGTESAARLSSAELVDLIRFGDGDGLPLDSLEHEAELITKTPSPARVARAKKTAPEPGTPDR